jgi:two-component system, NarL family, nitrate/nitrite response regulator NarL
VSVVDARVPDVNQGEQRLLLVDDHDLFRTGLAELLREQGFIVAAAADGYAGVSLCRTFRPHVVVMDMNMPGMSGIEATHHVLEIHPETAVLMLTVAADDDDVLQAIRAGACGYLLKEAHLAEIVAGIKAAADGRSPIAPQVAGALVASVRARVARPRVTADPALLTERERAVLSLLAEGHDNGDIAARLYVSPSTVKNHISHLLEKLGLENRVQAAAYAIRHGLDDAYAGR